MVRSDVFKSPLELLEWAKRDIDALISGLQELNESGRAVTVVQEKQVGSEYNDIFVELSPMPREWKRLVNTATTNIRHSFDQAFNAFCTLFDPNWNKSNNYFPWGASLKDTIGKLNKCPIPPAIHGVILGIRPFNSVGPMPGDDRLRDFAKLAGPAKHVEVIDLVPELDITRIETPEFEKGRYYDEEFFVPFSPVVPHKIDEHKFLVAKGTMDGSYDAAVLVDIVFRNTTSLPNARVIPVLIHAHETSAFLMWDLSRHLP